MFVVINHWDLGTVCYCSKNCPLQYYSKTNKQKIYDFLRWEKNKTEWTFKRNMPWSHIHCTISHSTYKLFAKKGREKRKMKWNQYCVRAWLLWPRLSGRLWQMKADGWKNPTLCSCISFSFPSCWVTVLLFIYNYVC